MIITIHLLVLIEGAESIKAIKLKLKMLTIILKLTFKEEFQE
jgi:hypothetical protein